MVDVRRVEVPTALAVFPRESPVARTWMEERFDLRRWTEMPRGGHFPALEEPELLLADVRAFFRPLRASWP
jgi:pimeloyl-ACP methyl ester carboxylesterase